MNEHIDILRHEYEIINNRKKEKTEGSYTNYLFSEGIDKILKKCGEECSEVIIAAKNGDKEQDIYEISDLLYHILVLMSNENITVDDLEDEFKRRNNKTNNLKQFHITDKNT
jgi:phosphoribosyl-ATP pyrophosphohydrolase